MRMHAACLCQIQEIYIDGRLALKNAGYFSLDQMLSRTEELLTFRQTESDDKI